MVAVKGEGSGEGRVVRVSQAEEQRGARRTRSMNMRVAARALSSVSRRKAKTILRSSAVQCSSCRGIGV